MTVLLATVTSAGFATIQDGGRHGFTDVGVPVSGAFHRKRYLVATALLSGATDERRPAIELLSGELSLASAAALLIAVVGPARLRVDGHRAAVGTAVSVPTGSTVTVATDGPGPVYLVIDGWQPDLVLGSAATDTFTGLGGGLLMPGTVLTGVSADADRAARVGAFHRSLAEPSGAVRVVGTGHPGLPAFVGQAWTVVAAARSGVRMSGRPIAASGSIPSAPLLPGAIQLTPGGEPIVIGPDGGVTGGYPVVAVVASVDVDRLSLLTTGDRVRFRVVEVAAAAQARGEQVRGRGPSIAHPDHLP